MAGKDEEFRKKLAAMFVVEAREHLDALSSHFLALEKTVAAEKQRELVEAAYREAHSLKGAARAANRADIEELCKPLESLLGALKRQELACSPELFDELHGAVDTFSKLLTVPETERAALEKSRIPELVQRLQTLSKGVVPPRREPANAKGEVSELLPSLPASHPSAVEDKPLLAETVRISTAKLNTLLLQAEELVTAKLIAGQRAAELRELRAALADWKKGAGKVQPQQRVLQRSAEKGLRGNGSGHSPNNTEERNAALKKLLEFLEGNARTLTDVEHRVALLVGAVEQDQRTLARLIDEHLQEVRKALMLPFSSLLESFPKVVRSLARDQGKEVELAVQGAEIEIDRRILEAMKDPFIHLVRNCIDHGIEKPGDRAKKNKPARGSIILTITQINSSHVEVRLADDGQGIDRAGVRAAASRLGLLPAEEAETLPDAEALPLVFASGVSTSSLITDISGHGLGLAIVREKVEALGGAVSVASDPSLGTTFRIVLPLTLATFHGVLVRLEEHLFVFPATEVQRILRVGSEEIKTVENRETIQFGGKAVSWVRLQDALQLSRKSAESTTGVKRPAVLVGSGEKCVAFLVDEVLGDQELLVKGLPWPLARVPNLGGATVLGSGQVVPILNIPELLKSAARAGAAIGKAAGRPPGEEKQARRKSVLVVEDSITARTLLKNILETAGYQVATAVDGLDAFTQLRTATFDVVVSDVDMPRMNGFELTAKIRGDKKSAELPVVLVTALGSREDREHGIEVGANAYIVKSSFDQSNLLEVLERLV